MPKDLKLPFDRAQMEGIIASHPTPFHIYDERAIRDNARRLYAAFAWSKGFREYFAIKATPNPHLLTCLREAGCGEVAVPRQCNYDLRTERGVAHFYDQLRPEVVIHLAAVIGGIGANRDNPGSFFYDNAVMGVQLIEFARRAGIEKFVSVGTVCSYPKLTPVPFCEKELWNGYPEETNAPYGLAKRLLLVQSQAYRQQYGLNAIYLIPVNLYGPGDNFSATTSHVIPAILRKCMEAKAANRESVTLWGDGSPTREFLYVGDAAEGIVKATRLTTERSR